jgi:hypothetical protein
MAQMSNSLGAIFAANDRMLADDRRRKAAEARARAKQQKAASRKQGGSLVGTGLGALAFLNPVTAPFAPALMAAGGTLGGMAAGGDVTADELTTVGSAAGTVMDKLEDPKKMEALKKLYASFGS